MNKIMFNDKYGQTSAVLEGRKTQIRRIVSESTLRKANLVLNICGGSIEERILEQTRYCFGEEIAVAQNLREMGNDPHAVVGGHIWGLDYSAAWTNKMYVSARQCIHHIRITDIRMERLQNISEEDCIKEGVRKISHVSLCLITYAVEDGGTEYLTPQEAYAALIDKISGKGTWEKNPWVFVYDFTLVD